MRFSRFVMALLCCLPSCGCTRMRFVIDAVPAQEKMIETTVMSDGAKTGGDKIVMIDVTGLIIDANRPGLLAPGENPMARFTESLQMAQDDPAVKAVVLHINSPGGTVTASDVMYREVLHFKQVTGKPVVVSMGDVAASGGYYLACSGDEIIAYPTTVTGSIGVIIQTLNFSEGMGRIGIKAESITSGPNKRMGSPFEPMTKEHHDLLQGLVDDFYANFKQVVTTNRTKIPPADLPSLTDGRVVTGTRAAQVGLVDRTGDLRDAFEAAKTRANLKTARLVKYHRELEYVGSPYAAAPLSAGGQVNLMQLNLDLGAVREQPGFYYLWDPSIW